MNKKSAFCSRFFFSHVVYGSCATTHNHYIFEKGSNYKMREKLQKQMPLMNPATDHDQAKELEAIDAILKKHPTICDLVYQDLCANRCVKTRQRGPRHERRAGAASRDRKGTVRFHV